MLLDDLYEGKLEIIGFRTDRYSDLYIKASNKAEELINELKEELSSQNKKKLDELVTQYMIMSDEECKSYFKIGMCFLCKTQNELEKVYQIYFNKE